MGEEAVLPLIEETARIDKQAVETGRCAGLDPNGDRRTGPTREPAQRHGFAVTRVPVNRTLADGETLPVIREGGGVTIIPVLKEILVVEKRLVLKEEVHIRRSSADEDVEVPVTLRKQRAVVERVSRTATPANRSIPFRPRRQHHDTDDHRAVRSPGRGAGRAGQACRRRHPAIGDQARARCPDGAHERLIDYHKDEGGFWGSLKDFFMPEEDRYAYSEGLSRGGTLLTASVEPTQTETAYDILEQHGSVDLDQRESTWRKEGWSGYSATGGTTTDSSTTGTTATGTAATGAAALKGAGTTTGETDYIPIIEERLNVGKRVAESGRVRVRSFVVEKPVEEQVTLRDETVHVDRARGRPAGDGGRRGPVRQQDHRGDRDA